MHARSAHAMRAVRLYHLENCKIPTCRFRQELLQSDFYSPEESRRHESV
jgi:hypothetical protein